MIKRLASLLLAAILWASPLSASQNSIVMPLTGPLTMAQVMTLVNLGLNTMASTYSGATPPAVSNGSPVVYQFWLDTSTAPRVLRMYDGSTWVPIGTLDDTSHAFSISVSSIAGDVSSSSYTFLDADKNTFRRFTNSGAVSVGLPQAGAGGQFLGGWFVDVRYTGTTSLTITPSTSTIDGGTSLVLTPGKSCRIYSTSTNYVTTCSLGTPTTSVLGGVFQMTAIANQWITGIDATGLFTRSQPAASNLSNGVSGSGAICLVTSCSLITPNLGVATATSFNGNFWTPGTGTLSIGAGKVFTVNNTVTFNSVNGTVFSTPAANDTLVGRASTDTMTNKTLTAPVINSPTGIVKADVGLSNVDNTSDATKNAASVSLTNKTIVAPVVTGLEDHQGALKFTGISAPAQITATQNNYNPSSVICSVDTLLLNSNASQNISGLAGGVSGCQLTIINNGSNPIVLQDQNAGSTATNRFAIGADATLAANTSYTLRYDATATRWRALVSPGAGGGGGGGVSSVACDGFGVECSTITSSGTVKGNYPHPFMLGGM